MSDLPEEAVEAAVKAVMDPEKFKLVTPAAHANHRAQAEAHVRAAAPAIEDKARREERERYEPVVAAARRLLRHSAGHPSRPSVQRTYWTSLRHSVAALEDSDA